MIALLSALLLAAPLVVDAERHTVTLEATATGVSEGTSLEFLLVDSQSEKDYEALFVTKASQAEIAAAFREAGIPCGQSVNLAQARLWPVGQQLQISPEITYFLKETREEQTPSVVYTGGTTNITDGYVFALYNCPQSLLQLNDSLEQSPTYGRFKPLKTRPKGTPQTFTFTWKGVSTWQPYTLTVQTNNLQAAVLNLKAAAEKSELDVTTDFAKSLTLQDAATAARVLEMLDSPRVKINGAQKGQFYYRAFLPKEQWRDRKERLAQPPELYLQADGSWKLVEIKEDWSDEDSIDPRLITIEHTGANLETILNEVARIAFKSQTAFVFVPSTTPLETLYKLKAAEKGTIRNWYFFTHE